METTLEKKNPRAYVLSALIFVASASLLAACGDSKSPGSDGAAGDGGRDTATGSDTGGDRGAGDGGVAETASDVGADRDAGDGGVATFVGDRRQPLIPTNDIQFIDFFVPHHRAAIEMAEMEIARGADAAVKAMATMMKASQMDEISKMRTARQQLAGSPDSPPPPPDPHMDREMNIMMGLSGAALDKVFLEEMIPHHAAALPVAHRSENLSLSDLKQLAASIYDAQAEEIGEMKMMLGEPTGGAVAVDGGVDAGDGGTGTAGGPGSPNDDTATVGDRRVPYTPANDLAFIDFFVPHHQAAIEMATMEIERGARADVKAMAQQIKTAQMAEIAKMRNARQQLAGSAESPPLPPDPHMMADMAAMMTLSGGALDQRFVLEMIPHHAAGLPPAHRGRPHLQRADLRQMALDIFSAQASEIGEMKKMLGQGVSGDGGTGDAADASQGQ
jgi:uncharacterized protein (DUF305 family)